MTNGKDWTICSALCIKENLKWLLLENNALGFFIKINCYFNAYTNRLCDTINIFKG